MHDIVQTCGNKLVGVCGTQDKINEEKDEQLIEALEQVKTNIPSWDSNKCPAMKYDKYWSFVEPNLHYHYTGLTWTALLLRLLLVLHLLEFPSYLSLLLHYLLSSNTIYCQAQFQLASSVPVELRLLPPTHPHPPTWERRD